MLYTFDPCGIRRGTPAGFKVNSELADWSTDPSGVAEDPAVRKPATPPGRMANANDDAIHLRSLWDR